jgi:two-component sensor histidine kinase
VDVIDRQLRQMTRLVDDLLDLSRLTRDTLELRPERLDLAAVVQVAVETSRPLIEASGQGFVVTLPPEPIALDADPIRLAQVLVNLLNNAAKYTEPSGHIGLTAERYGREAVVTVRDTGIGIPAELLPHIFEMFTQGEPSRARVQSGLGVGLTLVQRIVALHGGTITAHSDGPGQGSVFTVRLPIAREPAAARPGPGEVPARPPPAVARRILVVDDERLTAASLGNCCSARAMRSAPPTTASTRWQWPRRSDPTWCCPTSACRRSTATRWPTGSDSSHGARGWCCSH